jgi:iron(III) transport system permease protein
MGHGLTVRAPRLAARRPVRAEHIVMMGSVLAMTLLVVLPLTFLIWGSLTGDGRFTLDHFREALGSRLYLQALVNSLVLGLWTAVLSVAVGLPLAWAVSRTNAPARRFVHLTAVVSYVTPPYLTAIAFVNLFSPNAGLVNRFVRDVLGLPVLTFNIFSMAGLVVVTALHTFPFVYLLAASALESVDGSMEESAQILGASRWRTATAVTGPLVAPAVLSGALIAFVNAIALFGSQAIIGLPGRVFTLPTRIYALFDYPPQYGLASAMSLIFVAITVVIILLAYTGRYVPLGVRSANAAFRQIDPSLEETARVTGAGWFRTFRAVTLPLARPGLFAGWLLVFVPAIQELSASILLFSSGSITLAVAVYNLYETGALEPVAALAIVTMVIITAAVVLAARLGQGGAEITRAEPATATQ